MLSVIKIKGGLGNQMFQYAFYLALKEKHPLTWYLFDNEETRFCHHGITLEAVFGIKLSKKARWFRRLRRHFPIALRKAHHVEQENSLQYDERYLSERGLVTWYEGYWQSEKYFNHVADLVRQVFCFRKELMSERTLQLAETLRDGNHVSVHIRRGDYIPLADYHGLCDENYYQIAMRYIRERIPGAIFVFFSDDMDWVKLHLNEKESVYVDWNEGKESWQDMYLMSQCSHHIVANSSFSWWGAWLNEHPNQMVVAPSQWFKFSPNYNIIPDRWTTL